jgi:hypothetical protein
MDAASLLGTVQFRRGTAAEWTLANPILAAGEPGYETDTGRHKIGNGAGAWGALPYVDDAALTAAGNKVDNGRVDAYLGSELVQHP